MKKLTTLLCLLFSISLTAQVTPPDEKIDQHYSSLARIKGYNYNLNPYSSLKIGYIFIGSTGSSFRYIDDNPPINPTLKNTYQNMMQYEEADKGSLLGFLYEYRISSKVSYISGLQYSFYNERSVFETPDNSTQEMKYTYSFLELPVSLKVKFTDTRLSPYVMGGVAISFMGGFPKQELSEGYYESVIDARVKAKLVENQDVSEPNFTTNIAVGCQYLIPKTSISVFAHYYRMKQVKPLFVDYIEQELYQRGIAFGLTFWVKEK